jgi:hypothetical protein
MRKIRRSRRGVSSMIGGIIILTLFLSALSVMVFISQQYDTYQSTVETMNHKDIDAFSENLVPTYPGLYYNSNQTVSQGTCNPYCYQYVLYVSNNAAIGTQVTRIYINSTDTRPYVQGAAGQGVGCGNLCAFDPSNTPQPFHFLASSAFVNPSEYAHQLIFYTNNTYTLPCSQACGAYGVNSIAIATSRGRVFSFQWPIPPTGVATISYLTTGVMQIAYQGSGNPGYASTNEPAAISRGSGGTGTAGIYCHSESNATKVVTGSSYWTLWFVNPWVTMTIFNDAFPTTASNHTSFYVAVKVTNNQGGSIVITRGNMWLQLTVPQTGPTRGLARVLILGGPLVGTYYSGVFTPAGTQTTVASTYTVVLIYKINIWSWAADTNALPSGVTYSGMATMTNDQEGGGSTAYFSGTSVLDGLYVRTGC